MGSLPQHSWTGTVKTVQLVIGWLPSCPYLIFVTFSSQTEMFTNFFSTSNLLIFHQNVQVCHQNVHFLLKCTIFPFNLKFFHIANFFHRHCPRRPQQIKHNLPYKNNQRDDALTWSKMSQNVTT